MARIWSPSTIRPVGVDGQAAVGVTVERDAEVGAVLATTAERSESMWVEPQFSLMLMPSGVGVDPDHLGPLGLEGRRGRDVRGAVGAVDDDLEALQADRAAQAVDQVGDVVLDQRCVVPVTRPTPGAGGAGPALAASATRWRPRARRRAWCRRGRRT